MFESSAEDSLQNTKTVYDEYDEEPIIDDEDDSTRIIPPEIDDTKQCMKARYVLALLGFLGFANVYAMRVNLSVAIVAMVNNTAPAIDNSSSLITDVCPEPTPSNTTIPPTERGEFSWDEATQGVVLGSFFYGYVLTQVPGGRLAELFGGRRIFGYGVLITAIFTLLSPIAARLNYTLFIIVRILEGVGEGVTFPSMHAMLARWVPPWERSKFAAIVYQGANFGTIISLPLSGWLCSLEFDNGWPLAFYIFGILGIVWFFFWMWFIYDSPMVHPRIDPQERAFILASFGPPIDEEEHRGPLPWLKFLTCVPLWAILITQCGNSWMFYIQLTELPTYMKNILHFDIEQNAIYSAIPYLTSWIGGILFSMIADWLLFKGWLSPITSYKFFNTIASVIPSIGVLGVAWAGCDKLQVQLLLAVAGAFMGAAYAGNQTNHMALSPQYAGTMYGITNAAANMCGFLAPYATGLIINGQETLARWRLIFYIAATINISGNLFYLMFASAKEQEWSKPKRPPQPSNNVQPLHKSYKTFNEIRKTEDE